MSEEEIITEFVKQLESDTPLSLSQHLGDLSWNVVGIGFDVLEKFITPDDPKAEVWVTQFINLLRNSGVNTDIEDEVLLFLHGAILLLQLQNEMLVEEQCPDSVHVGGHMANGMLRLLIPMRYLRDRFQKAGNAAT